MPESDTRRSTRMPELDGLRAVAILLVIAYHSWYFLQFAVVEKETFLSYSNSLPWVMGFLRRGDVGVDIFFVLSGYLLSRQLFLEHAGTGSIDLIRFYRTRVLRIYPLYLTALALILFGGGGTYRMLGNIFATNIWGNPFNIVIPWSWSLSVEIEFYAIVPFLIPLARNGRAALTLVLGICALTLIWNLTQLAAHPQIGRSSLIEFELQGARDDLTRYFQYFYVAFPVRIGQFIIGLGAAWLSAFRPDLFATAAGKTRAAAILLAVGTAFIPLFYNPYSVLTDFARRFLLFDLVFGRLGFAFSIGLLIVLMRSDVLAGFKKILASRVLEPIARFSFAMYLFHPIFVYLGIIIFVGKSPSESISPLQNAGVFVISLSGSVALGFCSWYAIERPAIRFGRRLSQKTGGS